MKLTDEIIKAALLGTDRYSPQVPDPLKERYEAIKSAKGDKETRFWALAATTVLYESAGQYPLDIKTQIPESPAETLPLAADAVIYLMKSALQSKDEVFFQYLIHLCIKQGKVVRPELVPTLLDTALEQKKIADSLVKICGETGQWLISLNEKWADFTVPTVSEDIWETGTMAERKSFFTDLLARDPFQAIKILESTIASETSDHRVAFLEILVTNLSLHNEPFFQTLLKDKSTKVRHMAFQYLKGLEGSQMNDLYLSVLNQLLQINTRTLTLTKTMPDEAFFQTGIEKISSEKGVEDHVFHVAQILAYLNPTTFAKAYQIPEKDLIELLYQHAHQRIWLPYLVRATIAFKHRPWALFLLDREEKINMALLDVIDAADRIPYLEKLVEQNVSGFVHYMMDDDYTLIPTPLATQMMQALAKDPYQIAQNIYKRIALQMPFEILPVLFTIVNDYREDYQFRHYRNQVEEMCRIINTKEKLS